MAAANFAGGLIYCSREKVLYIQRVWRLLDEQNRMFILGHLLPVDLAAAQYRYTFSSSVFGAKFLYDFGLRERQRTNPGD
jgi:hypothetical protein